MPQRERDTPPDDSPGPPPGSGAAANEGEITRLLAAASDGDGQALDRLLPLVYDLLRDQARRALNAERSGHTLQPTALVHEAWMRLAQQRETQWADRSHFLATAAMMMRRILVSHARGRRRLKRGGGAMKLEFDHALADTLADPDSGGSETVTDLIALDDALTKLGQLDARLMKTVELRYFAGLSVEDTAAVLGVGTATVKRDWVFAKAWLKEAIGEDATDARTGGGS